MSRPAELIPVERMGSGPYRYTIVGPETLCELVDQILLPHIGEHWGREGIVHRINVDQPGPSRFEIAIYAGSAEAAALLAA